MSEIKSVEFKVKSLDEKTGTFEGYASVFGNVDSYGDITDKGAFQADIMRKGGTFPILFSHLYEELAIGKAIVNEDAYGLRVLGTLFIDRMEKAKNTFLNMVEGVSNSMSFMFDSVAWEFENIDGKQVRRLKEVKLYEVSLLNTGFGANDLAGVVSLKSFQDLQKKYNDLKNGGENIDQLNQLKKIAEILNRSKLN